ncbi:MAG: TIGR00730 family Rossman fold protein [Oscillospiraceae bacterium]|nr:TIGR00730 family Rossman fold protein [Oscillospiraceae bacterium]
MYLCVYGASSQKIDRTYIEAGEKLGEIIAGHGHGLVFGAGATGMMGAAARGVHRIGGEIIGIVPDFFNVDGELYEQCTELLKPSTMRARKQLLEERSDGFIITPGGIGTFDEFFEILTLKQLGRHQKPIVIYNINDYYDEMLEMLQSSMDGEFVRRDCEKLYYVTSDPLETVEYMENYVFDGAGVMMFKDI